jgi:actinin alpha
MALCALIHRHRPELIDYDSLDKKNKKENLQLAFDVAQKNLGIEPLLDADDLVATERPDERSVMTYISEFFHKFSSQDQKETAARRVQKHVHFHQKVESMEDQYQVNANDLVNWINEQIAILGDRTFDDSYDNAVALIAAHRHYKTVEKPLRNEFKLDIETLFHTINSTLKTNNRKVWAAPAGYSLEELDQGMDIK